METKETKETGTVKAFIACFQKSCTVLSHCFTVARVHGKVLSLSKSSWQVQQITEQSYLLRIQLRFA